MSAGGVQSMYWPINQAPSVLRASAGHGANRSLPRPNTGPVSHGKAIIPILQQRKLRHGRIFFLMTHQRTQRQFWQRQDQTLNLVLSHYTTLPPRLSGKRCNLTQEFCSGSSPQPVYLTIKATANSVYTFFYSLACWSQG